MTRWLLDVNLLLACGWSTHVEHRASFAWLLKAGQWATCSITEIGFMRISMTTAYRAAFEDARQSLSTLRRLPGHAFISDDSYAALLPTIASYKDTTDAHLVTLATRHGLKLATLDNALLTKSWASGCAVSPLTPKSSKSPP